MTLLRARAAYATVERSMRAKSARLIHSVEDRLPKIMMWWAGLVVLASILRILVSPIHSAPDAGTFLPYVLLVGIPLASMGLALHWFRDGDALAQPATRWARVGKWKPMRAEVARKHPLYGTTGIMVSLMIGMLLNVPVRALEYLAALPALAGAVPSWLSTLRFAMTLDVVLLSSLYAICFVAALRRVPLFPRLLLATWLIDIMMQLVIGRATMAAGDVPPLVASALHDLLDGNMKKVLISVFLWLPYLLLSRRVNVTFRNRIPIRRR